jgi:mannose-6-phosphate isomerase-like protein (cupin superfamily)
MSEIRMNGPGDGEVALSGPLSLRILEDGGTTAHRLGVAEIVIAPHTDGPPQHRHGEHDEGFYVVAGTVRFTSGDTWFDAPARTLVMVPPGAPHSFANPGGEPAVMLNTFTPDLYIGYFRELPGRGAAHRSERADAPLLRGGRASSATFCRGTPSGSRRRSRRSTCTWDTCVPRLPCGTPVTARTRTPNRRQTSRCRRSCRAWRS